MKRLVPFLLLPVLAATSFAGNFFGPGPFGNNGYWPGYLNGKYQAAVTGVNITGVLGFALVDGTPPSRETETQGAAGTAIVTRNVNLGVDPFQNYFMIFVEGRTYKGITSAMIDLDAKTVTGAMQGEDPVGLLPFSATPSDRIVIVDGVTNQTSLWLTNALPIVNRGLSGGFRANINNNSAVFTFSGNGQLSTPANNQTVTMTTFPIVANPADPPLVPDATITNFIASGSVQTESTPFTIRGIRTSFFSSNAVSSASLIGQ